MWTYRMCVSFQACLVSATLGCTECTSGGSCEPSADSAFIFHPHIPLCNVTTRRASFSCAGLLRSGAANNSKFMAVSSFFFGPYFVPAAWLCSCPTSLVGLSNRLSANQRITWQQFNVFREMIDWDFHARVSRENAWLRKVSGRSSSSPPGASKSLMKLDGLRPSWMAAVAATFTGDRPCLATCPVTLKLSEKSLKWAAVGPKSVVKQLKPAENSTDACNLWKIQGTESIVDIFWAVWQVLKCPSHLFSQLTKRKGS